MKKPIFALYLIIALAMSISAYSHTEKYTINIDEYNVFDRGGYDYVAISQGEFFEKDGHIQAPVRVEKYDIPCNQAIKSVSLFDFSDPVFIDANIPEGYYVSGQYGVKPRECALDSMYAYVDYYAEYGEECKLTLEFHPLEMEDCEEGIWNLYRTLVANVEYYNNNKFKKVEYVPKEGNSNAKVSLQLENLSDGSYLNIYDIAHIRIYEGIAKNTMEVEVNDTSGKQVYVIEIEEKGDVVAREVMVEDLDWGSIDFRVLVSDKKTVFPLAIEVYNSKGGAIPITMRIKSVYSTFEIGSEMAQEIKAPLGKSIHMVDFQVQENETRSSIIIEAFYNGIREYAEGSTMMRYTYDEVKGGLPDSPAEVLMKDIAEAVSEGGLKESTLPGEGFSSSTLLGVVIVIALFAVVIYLVRLYLKSD